MTTQEVADKYYELFKKRDIPTIYNTLYHADIVNTEPEHASARGLAVVTKGIEAVQAKSKATSETIAELHSFHVTEPVVGGTYFSVAMRREFTLKNGQRIKGEEIAVFGVKDDKIISETFFY